MNAPFKPPAAASAVGAALAAEALRKRQPEPDHRRTHQRVRRNSRRAGGKWEDEWRNRLTLKQRGRLLLAAEIYDREGKVPGARNGALGHRGWQLLRLLTRVALKGRGFIDRLSMVAMARMLKCSIATVEAAKKALRRAGFLAWQRRYVETGEAGPVRGPQVEQTTNIYRLMLPTIAATRLEKLLPAAPIPADAEAERAAKLLALRAMWEADETEPLAVALAKLGAAVTAAPGAGTAPIPTDPGDSGKAGAAGTAAGAAPERDSTGRDETGGEI